VKPRLSAYDHCHNSSQKERNLNERNGNEGYHFHPLRGERNDGADQAAHNGASDLQWEFRPE
jgi:hypothetical protein